MSRWTVPQLSTLTEQQVFDVCAYHLLARGGAPRDLLLKPDSREFNRRRSWPYYVRQKRAPKHAAQLIADIERIHKHQPPELWLPELTRVAALYNLEPPK